MTNSQKFYMKEDDHVSHKYIIVHKLGAKRISEPDSYSLVFDKYSLKKNYKVCFT